MVVYYGDDTGGYVGHVNAPNYPAYHDPAENRLPPWYGSTYNVSTINLRPDIEVRRDGDGDGRHRSLLPPVRCGANRRRRDRSPPTDPVRKAQNAIKDAFTNSTSGVSVGVLGAIIGGLVAREASGAATTNSSSSKTKPDHGEGGRRRSGNHHHHHHHQKRYPAEQERTRLISTLVGAAVGGFGANALEKRIEVAKERTAEKEEAWEQKWGQSSRDRMADGMDNCDDSDDDRSRRRSQRRYNGTYVRDRSRGRIYASREVAH